MTFANLLYFAEISGQQKPIFLSWNFSRDLRLPVAMTSLVYAVSPSTQACAVTSTNSCERGTQELPLRDRHTIKSDNLGDQNIQAFFIL